MFKTVIFDRCTVVADNDVDLGPILSLADTEVFDLVSRDELIARAKNANAIICNKAVIDREVIENCPNLKYVGLFATGYNNIDLDAANERGIYVANAPSYSTDSVAQQVFAFILGLSVSLTRYNDTVHSGEWCRSAAFTYLTEPMQEIKGKTLGIFGFGAIGKAVARLGDAFGMKVIIHTRTAPTDCPYEVVSKEDLFKRSDYLTLHCPLNEQTKNIINHDSLALMKPTAYFINTSRGGTVMENDLCDALNNGTIAGAGIDVVSVEPMREDNPLLQAKNCIITPHTAWATIEARCRLIDIVAGNLDAFLKGEPVNIVNQPR